MNTNEALRNFLYEIEKFYQPENPLDKDGIGHEVEHIKGVIHRSEQIADIINDNLNDYNEKTPLDINLVTAIACLHDIGNVIGRDAHNHFGAGIVLGKLNFEYIARVPIEADKRITTAEERKNAVKYFDSNKYKLNNLDNNSPLYKLISEIYRTQAQFYFSYEGNNIHNEEQLRDFFKLKFEGIDESALDQMCSGIVDATGKFTYNYLPSLKVMTAKLQEVYNKRSDEIYIIADAVQDHNIDFERKNESKIQRYASRSIYGKIISDADKDNIPETFALRTLAYAYNKFGRQKKLPYMMEKDKAGRILKNKDGSYKIDLQQCLKHICHQANERCRPSLEEYISEDPTRREVMPIFPDVLNYKELSKIKGVTINPDGAYEIYTPQHGEMKYDITLKAGDDAYSELDQLSGNALVKNLRNDYIQKMHKWGNPEYVEESLKELQPILQTFLDSPSLEAAVDEFERQYWGDEDNSFKNIIDSLITDDSAPGGTGTHDAGGNITGDENLDELIDKISNNKEDVPNVINKDVEVELI